MDRVFETVFLVQNKGKEVDVFNKVCKLLSSF